MLLKNALVLVEEVKVLDAGGVLEERSTLVFHFPADLVISLVFPGTASTTTIGFGDWSTASTTTRVSGIGDVSGILVGDAIPIGAW